jgi:hypothetical protein
LVSSCDDTNISVMRYLRDIVISMAFY